MLPRLKRDFDDATVLLHSYEKWDHATTKNVQLEKLRSGWRDAVEDVPYYARLVAAGAAPREIRSWKDFHALPELTRAILQDHPEEFVRRSGPPDLTRMTGGSTGNPVHFGVWKTEDRVVRLLKLTLWIRAGYRPRDRLFLIWGHSHLLGSGWRRYLNHVLRKAKDVLLRYHRVDAYRLDLGICRSYAEKLLEFRPAGLIGYASALDTFVRMNAPLEPEFRQLGLRFVMPCAEPAPKPDSYDLFRNAFGCPVVQEFGGVDFGQVASQYDREPFFVFPDMNIVETPASNTGDDTAAVLVTSLYRRYLPLFRYRQGDLISGAERDAQGHVRAFEALHGRVNDMIRLDSGAEVHSVAIFHCIHQEPSVLNIQMILNDDGPRLRLATFNCQISPEVEARIRQRLGQVSSELSGISFETVADLETTRAGKRRWLVDRRTSNLDATL